MKSDQPENQQQQQNNTGNAEQRHPWRELRLRGDLRRELQLNSTLLSRHGKEIQTDLTAIRQLAESLNSRHQSQQPVTAAAINALGLLDELKRQLISFYLDKRDSDFLVKLQTELEEEYEQQGLMKVLAAFTESFPPLSMLQEDEKPAVWLQRQSSTVSHLQTAIGELLLLRLDNDNPACGTLRDLIDDSDLRRDTNYNDVIQSLELFFSSQSPLADGDENLLTMLRAPAKDSPESLSGQLKYIRDNWKFLDSDWMEQLLRALDLTKEEEKLGRHGAGGPAVSEVWTPTVGDEDEQRYSHDSDWMPRVVMQAKNTHVWLEQLSREYGYHVSGLDRVPDAELEQMARRGITALWLIGVWERSSASRRIKQLMGDGEALASAYSLYGYQIASELGGEEALKDLRERAARLGIRLAGDMVPNHTGIDSHWVRNYPDRFVQLAEPPYPNYTFNGENLSGDDSIDLKLEDGYSRRDDAAVVFRREDRQSGEVRYLYHGNDGTQMPWNDTAQLDLLQAEVREAVIQEILDVARRFPLIRFDAAMTLARKHFQRLWYPAPGSGGDIPSRAERGLASTEFINRFPVEFWREVVDRVQEEVPDTLLLAEAFWLMEGYFVRTLGMHRVYNSAFMHMLRDEENSKYRAALKETLAWDARVLERYVNFMSNPDEDAAVTQFGRDDKYMGIAILLATLPGLPMLGHGQLEGLEEKYGMEFLKPRSDEQPDRELMARHERLLYPLLQQRRLFAEVKNFQLYDLQRDDGSVDEEVYAYSNRHHGEKALVVYHNSYATTSGWVQQGVEVKPDGNNSRRDNLANALELSVDGLCRFRDHVTGLEYLRRTADLHSKGLRLELQAYSCHVFLDFSSVEDSVDEPWSQLAQELAGRGVSSLRVELQRLRCRPLQKELKHLISREESGKLLDALRQDETDGGELYHKSVERLLEAASDSGCSERTSDLEMVEPVVQLSYQLPRLLEGRQSQQGWSGWLSEAFGSTVENQSAWQQLLAYSWLSLLSMQLETDEDWLVSWGLDNLLQEELAPIVTAVSIDETIALLHALLELDKHADLPDAADSQQRMTRLLSTGLKSEAVQRFIGVNEHESINWFSREMYHKLLNWLPLVDQCAANHETLSWETVKDYSDSVELFRRYGETAAYQLEQLLVLLAK